MSSSDTRNLQPLAPAPLAESVSAAASTAPSLVRGSHVVPPRRRGKQINLACDACRGRKTKCDGQRPNCQACEDRKTDCFYDVESREANTVTGLRRRISVLEEDLSKPQSLLRYLQQASLSDAQEVLVKWRGGAELADVVNLISQSDIGEMQHQQEIGAASSGRYPYSTGRRISDNTTRSGFDVGNVTGSMSSPPGSADAHKSSPLQHFTEIAIPVVRSPHTKLKPTIGAGMPMIPSLSRQTPFLELRAQPWTTVSLDDHSFSHLICLWLSHHALHLPYIYPTLFIEGLRTGRPNEHCSSILVSAVLALACQYSTDIPASGPPDQRQCKGHDFYSEAHTLWQQEEGRITLPTIQALVAMYEYNKLRGKDRLGWLLLQGAVEGVAELGLCNREQVQAGISEESLFARSFIAWSLYNYQAVESLMFRKLPRLRRCKAPRPRGPFRTSVLTEKWRPYGIADNVTRESYFWEHWNAFCSLSNIIASLTQLLFGPDEDEIKLTEEAMSLSASRLLTDVLAWHSNLPYALSLEVNEMPHNLWLHMNCHLVIMALPHPKLPPIELSPQTNLILNIDDAPPHQTTRAALNIVRLIRIALEQFGEHHRTIYESQICAAAASTLLHELATNRALEEDFLQCIAYLHRQGTQAALPAALARALLWVACEGSGLAMDADHVFVDVFRYNAAHDLFAVQGVGIPAGGVDGARDADGQGSLARLVVSRFPVVAWDRSGGAERETLTDVLERLVLA